MQEEIEKPTVTVIGLGYVGLTLAIAIASTARYKVIGVERNLTTLNLISNRATPFIDDGLQDALTSRSVIQNFSVLSAISDLPLGQSKIFIIAIGTPFLEGTRNIDLETLNTVLEELQKICVGGEKIILRSTVPIGTTNKLSKMWESRKSPHVNFYFAPERTIEGIAFKELFELPQIIGAVNSGNLEPIKELFEALTSEIVEASSAEEAEAAKLISNTWRDYSFAFSNFIQSELASLNIDGGNVIRMVNDRYKRGSIPLPGYVGGPCLSKDSDILNLSIKNENSLIMHAREVNEKFVEKIILSAKGLRIGILGLAFKGRPETDDLRSSFAKNIGQVCRDRGALEILGWDPIVEEVPLSWGITILDLDLLLERSDVIILQNNHAYFSSQDFLLRLNSLKTKPKILDIWKNIKNVDLESQLIFRLGGENADGNS